MNTAPIESVANGPKLRRRLVTALCGFALIVPALAACTADDPTTPDPGASGDVATAEEIATRLAELTDPDGFTFPAPTDPVTAIEPHKIAIVVDGLAFPGTSTLMPYVAEAAEAIGWEEPQIFDGEYNPATQASAITQALNSGADGLVLGAISPTTVASALEPALAAGVPVVCLNCGAPTDPGNDVEGVAYVSDSTYATAEAWAVWVAADSGGDAKVALFNDSEYAIVEARFNFAQETFAKYCPGCELENGNITMAQVFEPSVPTFRAFLNAHPVGTLDYIVAPQDIAMPIWAQAASQMGRDDIKFIGYAALPPTYDYMLNRDPSGIEATVAIPIPYYGWAGVDQLARMFNDQPTWEDSWELPTGLVTIDNMEQFQESADAQDRVPSITSSDDFRAHFLELWGK